jgi:hypothetical protein
MVTLKNYPPTAIKSGELNTETRGESSVLHMLAYRADEPAKKMRMGILIPVDRFRH